jgi:hypothetical protein
MNIIYGLTVGIAFGLIAVYPVEASLLLCAAVAGVLHTGGRV